MQRLLTLPVAAHLQAPTFAAAQAGPLLARALAGASRCSSLFAISALFAGPNPAGRRRAQGGSVGFISHGRNGAGVVGGM